MIANYENKTDNGYPVCSESLDSELPRMVANHPGGEKIFNCFSCGTCVASCTVSDCDTSFDPRKIIRMILLGMKEQLFKSNFMWLCTGCHICTDRCPQGVKISEIMTIIKNMAVAEGIIHPAYQAQADELAKFGRLYETAPFNKKRGRASLPPVEDNPEPVRRIFNACKTFPIDE